MYFFYSKVFLLMHLSKILQKIGQLFALRWQDTDVVVGENSLPAGFVLFTIQKTNLDLPPPPPPHYLLPSPRDHKLRESWWNRKHEAVTGWSNPSQGERIVTDRPAASHAFSVKSSLLFFFFLSLSITTTNHLLSYATVWVTKVQTRGTLPAYDES